MNKKVIFFSEKVLRDDVRSVVLQIDGFIKTGILSDKIMDGYKDGGYSSNVTAIGSVTGSNREIIVVNREMDSILRRHIIYVNRSFSHLNKHDKVANLASYVYSYLGGNDSKIIEKTNLFTSTYKGIEVLLGDICYHGYGVCRHRALLFKVLADELGIETALVRGYYSEYNQYDSNRPNHAWNIVSIEDELYLVDTMHAKLVPWDYAYGEAGHYYATPN